MSDDVRFCLENLVSYEEIAELLSVQKATVWRWKSVGMLPEPVGAISGRHIWLRSTILEWAEATGRTITF